MTPDIVDFLGAALLGGLGVILLRNAWSRRRSREGSLPKRFSVIHDLLDSLELMCGKVPDPSKHAAVMKFEELAFGRLSALSDFLYHRGLEDIDFLLRERVILKTQDQHAREYLRCFVIPEVRARLHDMESGKSRHALLDAFHPVIADVVKERYAAGHFADAVEAALKEVNSRVKAIVLGRIGQELDGANLMRRAFSEKQPVVRLADLTESSGRNMQLGFMDIFAGAMTGIRNPKAHANLEIDEIEAIHLIGLASLLMMKLDREVNPVVSTAERGAAADA